MTLTNDNSFRSSEAIWARSRWSQNPSAQIFYKRAKRLAGTAGNADYQRKRIAELTMK